jgi:hypothetical protein
MPTIADMIAVKNAVTQRIAIVSPEMAASLGL